MGIEDGILSACMISKFDYYKWRKEVYMNLSSKQRAYLSSPCNTINPIFQYWEGIFSGNHRGS